MKKLAEQAKKSYIEYLIDSHCLTLNRLCRGEKFKTIDFEFIVKRLKYLRGALEELNCEEKADCS